MTEPLSQCPVNVGDVIASKYRVDQVLAAGGMGVVVAATHLELEQRVALKFLLPAVMKEPTAIERFLREARAAARLASPHVTRTLDTGRLADGSPYIVMELLHGRDLEEELTRVAGPLHFPDAVGYVLQACDALAEAHAAGIIHRDLKPSNLFLSRARDGRPHIKVLDFGISKLGAAAGGVETGITAQKDVFGSPAYMSPEQMHSARDVDERTDVWALGVVLYELLTGTLPFSGESTLAMMLSVAQREPEPPSTRAAGVPIGLDPVVLRCLAKDREKRYRYVEELADALAPFAKADDRALVERIRAVRAAEADDGAAGGNVSRSDRRGESTVTELAPAWSAPLPSGRRGRWPGSPVARALVFAALAGIAASSALLVARVARPRAPEAPVGAAMAQEAAAPTPVIVEPSPPPDGTADRPNDGSPSKEPMFADLPPPSSRAPGRPIPAARSAWRPPAASTAGGARATATTSDDAPPGASIAADAGIRYRKRE